MRHNALIIHNCKIRQRLFQFSLIAFQRAYWGELGDKGARDMSQRVKYATVHHVPSRENYALELNFLFQQIFIICHVCSRQKSHTTAKATGHGGLWHQLEEKTEIAMPVCCV